MPSDRSYDSLTTDLKVGVSVDLDINQVGALFFAEAALLALFGGVVGFAGGALLAQQIGRSIFGSRITIEPVLFPVILGIAVLVTFAGSALAIRRAVKFDPVYALRGEA